MAQRVKHMSRGADVAYLLRELRRLSTQPQTPENIAFWKIVRGHLRQRRGR